MSTKPHRYRRSVGTALDRDFRAGGAKPDLERYLEPIDETYGPDDRPVEIDLDLVEGLVEFAVGQEDWDDNALDQWLAVRLHNGLRIPQRVAGDRGFWAWLAVEAGQDYVTRRWLGKNEDDPETVTMYRYTGSLLRNALSRLWWGAEMVRDGPDYRLVEHAFSRVVTAQYVLELMYSWYRPAAVAFTKVAEGLGDHPGLNTDEMRDLSVKINSYLSLRSLERMGLQNEPESDTDYAWLGHRPALKELVEDEELTGPEDGYVDDEAVEDLEEWFSELVEEERGATEAA